MDDNRSVQVGTNTASCYYTGTGFYGRQEGRVGILYGNGEGHTHGLPRYQRRTTAITIREEEDEDTRSGRDTISSYTKTQERVFVTTPPLTPEWIDGNNKFRKRRESRRFFHIDCCCSVSSSSSPSFPGCLYCVVTRISFLPAAAAAALHWSE